MLSPHSLLGIQRKMARLVLTLRELEGLRVQKGRAYRCHRCGTESLIRVPGAVEQEVGL